jgi:hypothetical protein
MFEWDGGVATVGPRGRGRIPIRPPPGGNPTLATKRGIAPDVPRPGRQTTPLDGYGGWPRSAHGHRRMLGAGTSETPHQNSGISESTGKAGSPAECRGAALGPRTGGTCGTAKDSRGQRPQRSGAVSQRFTWDAKPLERAFTQQRPHVRETFLYVVQGRPPAGNDTTVTRRAASPLTQGNPADAGHEPECLDARRCLDQCRHPMSPF